MGDWTFSSHLPHHVLAQCPGNRSWVFQSCPSEGLSPRGNWREGRTEAGGQRASITRVWHPWPAVLAREQSLERVRLLAPTQGDRASFHWRTGPCFSGLPQPFTFCSTRGRLCWALPAGKGYSWRPGIPCQHSQPCHWIGSVSRPWADCEVGIGRGHAGNRLHREGEGQRAGNVTSGATRLDARAVCTAALEL